MNIKIFVLFLAGSLLFSGCTVFSMDLKPKEEFEEHFVCGNEASSNKILVIPVTGLIVGSENYSMFTSQAVVTPDKIKELLMKSEKDNNIKAIILEIDSPGGGVTASDIIHKTLKEYKARFPQRPVIALMKDTAASGGYYVAMTADYLIAHPTSIVGSIGVISVFITIEDLLGKIGVETVVVKSGQAKDIGSPFRKMTPPEKEFMQNIIDRMYKRFIDIVYENRKNALSREELARIADGRVLTGEQALDSKLVDATGYMSDAFAKAKEMSKITEAKVIQYQKRKGVFETAFRLESPANEISMLTSFILKDSTSRFMYLWMPSLDK
ncbi:MAG: signal peptide peptidase SppA [Planctomycetota bacterium]